jgi:hypothetical protein
MLKVLRPLIYDPNAQEQEESDDADTGAQL